MVQEFYHHPVLAGDVVKYLISKPDGIYVDCTLGGGGHSELILEKLNGKGMLLGLDADMDAIQFASERLSIFSNKIIKRAFFDQLDVVLVQDKLLPADGFLFDLGISSHQIDKGEKGFSFSEDGPLDMRFNNLQKLTAAEVINRYDEKKLAEIIRSYGEERQWRKIVRQLIRKRSAKIIETTSELKDIISSVILERFRNKTLARIFQAIRIEVNQELERLKTGLNKAFDALNLHGRIVVISYHSLEDRIVKEFFRYKELDCICPPDYPECVCDKEKEMKILTRKPIRPSEKEIADNPRARSARLRAAEKIIDFRDQ
jgi:16S rRNA (cytosine1402-N4)-methyltransferase